MQQIFPYLNAQLIQIIKTKHLKSHPYMDIKVEIWHVCHAETLDGEKNPKPNETRSSKLNIDQTI